MCSWEWFARQAPTLTTPLCTSYVATTPVALPGLEQSTLTRTFLNVGLVVYWSRFVVVQSVQGFVIKGTIANSSGLHQQLIVIVGRNVSVKH